MKRIIAAITFLAFLVVTVLAVVEFGYLGIFLNQLQNIAGIQVLLDLVIALSLFIFWLWGDTKKFNRPFWPWVVLILATGSVGALVYVLLYKTGSDRTE